MSRNVDLPHSLAICCGSLELNENNLLVFDGLERGVAKSLLGDSGRKAETNEEKTTAIEEAMRHTQQFAASASEGDHAPISAAIEWYQDSLYSDNQTFAYLAACIGLEAILGSGERIDNMTSRLIDRYSFLLGRDRDERKRLSADYHKVLTLRGDLVHAKQARLTGDSKRYLSVAQGMLRSAIWHELHRVYQNQRIKAR